MTGGRGLPNLVTTSLEILLAEPLGGELQRAPRRELRADAVAESVGQIVFVRDRRADLTRRCPRPRRTLATSLLTMKSKAGVHLAGASAAVSGAGGQLDHAAHRNSNRLLPRLGQQVDLGAEEGVAELVADPSLLGRTG